jgi:PIN domain nuclease of toxin-antitoxin system
MECILDTQIIIWFQLFEKKLSSSIYELLADTKNTIFVSQISLFEIAIKQKTGKLPELDKPIEEIIELIKNDGFKILSIKNSHIIAYHSVPFFADLHKDPFDRLLIATALFENLPIISADEKFRLYDSIVTLIKA